MKPLAILAGIFAIFISNNSYAFDLNTNFKTRNHFEIQMLNLDIMNTASVQVTCYDKNGNEMAAYNNTYYMQPKSIEVWSSSDVMPPPSGVAYKSDSQHIWCTINSSVAIVTFSNKLQNDYLGYNITPVRIMKVAR